MPAIMKNAELSARVERFAELLERTFEDTVPDRLKVSSMVNEVATRALGPHCESPPHKKKQQQRYCSDARAFSSSSRAPFMRAVETLLPSLHRFRSGARV